MDSRLKALPAEFWQRLTQLVPPGLLHDVGRGFLATRPHFFRINTLRGDEARVLKEFQKQSWQVRPVRGVPLCYSLSDVSFRKLENSSAYQDGRIYLQNPSSQIPPLVLAPEPGERVLDLCASPGSKTTQIAALMQGQGEITAVEPDRIRYDRLLKNLQIQGAGHVTAVHRRGEAFAREYLQKIKTGEAQPFDRILADVPCSGEGTFSAVDPISFRHWSEDFVAQMAKLQIKLLLSAAEILKPGGVLVYSTCSLSPEENEFVVAAALKAHGDLCLEALPIKLEVLRQPIASWRGVSTIPDVLASARRIFPSVDYEGFFVCRIRKQG